MAINGFEKETNPLSPKETKWATLLARALKVRVGAENCITSDQIIANFRAMSPPIKITGSRVRRMINHIRCNRWVTNLVATNNGYYVETDQKKILLYVTGLRQRVEAIEAVINSFKVEPNELSSSDRQPGSGPSRP